MFLFAVLPPNAREPLLPPSDEENEDCCVQPPRLEPPKEPVFLFAVLPPNAREPLLLPSDEENEDCCVQPPRLEPPKELVLLFAVLPPNVREPLVSVCVGAEKAEDVVPDFVALACVVSVSVLADFAVETAGCAVWKTEACADCAGAGCVVWAAECTVPLLTVLPLVEEVNPLVPCVCAVNDCVCARVVLGMISFTILPHLEHLLVLRPSANGVGSLVETHLKV